MENPEKDEQIIIAEILFSPPMNLHYLIRGLVIGKNKVGMPIYWHSDR